MGTEVVTTIVDNIPLHKRLAEIMQDKGKHYSLRAVASRIGINREDFRKMIGGVKEIHMTDLERIANDLGISLDRIMQADIKYDVAQLDWCLNGLTHLGKAKELAHHVCNVAVGATEKCVALNNLGRVYYELRQYTQAHKYWVDAYSYSLVCNESIGDRLLLNKVLSNLMLSYTQLKDYGNARCVLEEVEELFREDPKIMAQHSYSLAMIAYDLGDYIECKERLEKSLELFEETKLKKEIGKALHNVGFIQYVLGNLLESKQLFERAIELLLSYPVARLWAVKDYVKVLIKLGDIDDAVIKIETSLKEFACHQNIEKAYDLRAKLMLMLADIKEDESLAQTILEWEISNKIRKLVYDFLIRFYANKGDSESVMKYIRCVGEMTKTSSPFFDEEGY